MTANPFTPPAVAADPSRWQANIACRAACPAGTDARAFVAAISEERYLDAYRIARASNPFASVCARVCPAPCESACVRGNLDAPVAIRALERFVCEQYGPESVQGPDLSLALSSARRGEPNGRRVAIAGAGVCGLAAAHDLALLGYSVTLFESGARPGGALLQVPEIELPARVRDAEIAAILALAITVEPGVTIGDGLPISGLLEQGFEAVCLAAGGEAPEEVAGAVFAAAPSASVVEAVAAGCRLAAEADAFLTGVFRERVTTWAMTRVAPGEFHPSALPRETPPDVPGLPAGLSFSEEQAKDQASRCLKCHINAVFESARCTLCGDCARVCPTHAIRLVPTSEGADAPSQLDTAILLDDSHCSRCALCAAKCPEAAVSMRAFEDETESLPVEGEASPEQPDDGRAPRVAAVVPGVPARPRRRWKRRKEPGARARKPQEC